MKLTGNAKKEFEKWYLAQSYCTASLTEYSKEQVLKMFYALYYSFKYSVLVDFFESEGLFIEINVKRKQQFNYVIYDDVDWIISSDYINDRNKIRQKAIEKVNSMYNGL